MNPSREYPLMLVEVGDQSVQPSVAHAVPFCHLASQHADRVEDVETTASGEVQDFHQDARSRRCESAFRLKTLLLKVGVVKAWRWCFTQRRDGNVGTF